MPATSLPLLVAKHDAARSKHGLASQLSQRSARKTTKNNGAHARTPLTDRILQAARDDEDDDDEGGELQASPSPYHSSDEEYDGGRNLQGENNNNNNNKEPDILSQLRQRIDLENEAEHLERRKQAWEDGSALAEVQEENERANGDSEAKIEQLEAMIDAEAQRLRAILDDNEAGGGEDHTCTEARGVLEQAASAQAKLKRDNDSLRSRVTETRKRLDRFDESTSGRANPLDMLKELETLSAQVGEPLS